MRISATCENCVCVLFQSLQEDKLRFDGTNQTQSTHSPSSLQANVYCWNKHFQHFLGRSSLKELPFQDVKFLCSTLTTRQCVCKAAALQLQLSALSLNTQPAAHLNVVNSDVRPVGSPQGAWSPPSMTSHPRQQHCRASRDILTESLVI